MGGMPTQANEARFASTVTVDEDSGEDVQEEDQQQHGQSDGSTNESKSRNVTLLFPLLIALVACLIVLCLVSCREKRKRDKLTRQRNLFGTIGTSTGGGIYDDSNQMDYRLFENEYDDEDKEIPELGSRSLGQGFIPKHQWEYGDDRFNGKRQPPPPPPPAHPRQSFSIEQRPMSEGPIQTGNLLNKALKYQAQAIWKANSTVNASENGDDRETKCPGWI